MRGRTTKCLPFYRSILSSIFLKETEIEETEVEEIRLNSSFSFLIGSSIFELVFLVNVLVKNSSDQFDNVLCVSILL